MARNVRRRTCSRAGRGAWNPWGCACGTTLETLEARCLHFVACRSEIDPRSCMNRKNRTTNIGAVTHGHGPNPVSKSHTGSCAWSGRVASFLGPWRCLAAQHTAQPGLSTLPWRARFLAAFSRRSGCFRARITMDCRVLRQRWRSSCHYYSPLSHECGHSRVHAGKHSALVCFMERWPSFAPARAPYCSVSNALVVELRPLYMS